ncbi:transposase family protein [Crateriforma conspicua]|uniref:H repeat-associated protein N-terminal domain-containing protein n=1 Tax=Crateriforma conspicua TaxID=2527996 RepID=A0A5C5Y563_9PLAN|nr:transposase family protein [Crateriforma conspicua]QDV64446.1 hypothetical protein Mal65_36040 [Crateriforma conspicua]TWT69843.1 hypothetical protein Pan14r_21390 [Crateriforma conspicua]
MGLSTGLTGHLHHVVDPRTVTITYPFTDILFMIIGAVIAGAHDFGAMAHIANTKKEWFEMSLNMT